MHQKFPLSRYCERFVFWNGYVRNEKQRYGPSCPKVGGLKSPSPCLCSRSTLRRKKDRTAYILVRSCVCSILSGYTPWKTTPPSTASRQATTGEAPRPSDWANSLGTISSSRSGKSRGEWRLPHLYCDRRVCVCDCVFVVGDGRWEGGGFGMKRLCFQSSQWPTRECHDKRVWEACLVRFLRTSIL